MAHNVRMVSSCIDLINGHIQHQTPRLPKVNQLHVDPQRRIHTDDMQKVIPPHNHILFGPTSPLQLVGGRLSPDVPGLPRSQYVTSLSHESGV